MSVSFTKSGIVTASGIEVGANLMPNSLQMQLGSANPSTGTWRLAGSSTMTRSRVQIDDITYGFQNVGTQTANDGSCYGIDSFPMIGNTKYTISFDAKLTDGTEGYAGFSIYSCTVNGGSYTKVDKNYYVTPLTKNWTRCWVTFTTNANANRNIYIGITTGDTTVTTQMCRVKLELGSTPTPWIPNSADYGAVPTQHGFAEQDNLMKVYEDYITTTEFIEY